nr:MAG TPA: hypothetical protein [Caudoviricetes sp.]
MSLRSIIVLGSLFPIVLGSGLLPYPVPSY